MRRPSPLSPGVILTALVLGGVLAALVLLPATQAKRLAGREASRRAVASASAPGAPEAPASDGQAGNFARYAAGEAFPTALQIAGQAPAADPDRKIIYEAQIALVVADLAETESAVARLLDEYEGYVGESNVTGRRGDRLTGLWRVRIPVARFDEFLAALAKLGVTENRQQTAKDVSEEFVDLAARIANQQELERRIVALLDTASDDIEDVIQVEQQLARVRGEIEQMEGRLRFLANRVELTTVSITAREERDYVPPEAPTFATQVRDAWSGSLQAMRSAGERLSLAAVAAAPWIVALAAVLGLPAWWLGRRRARRQSMGLDSPA